MPSLTVTDYIRSRLLANVPAGRLDVPSIERIVAEDWSWHFVQLCLNRIVMGRFRYGCVKDSRKDNIAAIRARLALYEQTGNLEYMVDVSNIAHCEFMNPSSHCAYFAATDDGEHFQNEQ